MSKSDESVLHSCRYIKRFPLNLTKMLTIILNNILIFQFKISSDMVCSVAGITSDANVLTNELRVIGKQFQLD